MDEKLRILLCEDDENLGMLLREYLQAKGYSAELFPDGFLMDNLGMFFSFEIYVKQEVCASMGMAVSRYRRFCPFSAG